MASSLPYTQIYHTTKATKLAMQSHQKSTRGVSSSTTTANDTLNSSFSDTNTTPPVNRRTSLSSFPASRSPSAMSRNSRPSRSPNPPMAEANRSSDPSSNSKTPSSGVSSQHSSLSAPRKYNPDAHPKRKLRSQYPRGEGENHVEYILVASFDIDKGPIMEHQFPVAITGDEHMLAELMLPDQAHVRNQDWTIFFLHKDTSQEDEEAEQKEERRKIREGKRAANGGKDLEDEELTESENSDDSEAEGGEGPPLIYVLNLVNTKQDKTAKRGAVVKAMAICTRHPFLHIYKVSFSPKPATISYPNAPLALAIIGPRRVLQKSTSGDAGVAVRGSQHNGFITNAKIKSVRTLSSPGK